MARSRRTYTAEFKTAAVQLVTDKGYSFAEAARSLDITENLLRKWKQVLDAEGNQAFPGHGQLSPFEDEVRRLRADNRRLLMERDILKKRRPSSRRRPYDLSLHCGPSRPVARPPDVPRPRRLGC